MTPSSQPPHTATTRFTGEESEPGGLRVVPGSPAAVEAETAWVPGSELLGSTPSSTFYFNCVYWVYVYPGQMRSRNQRLLPNSKVADGERDQV